MSNLTDKQKRFCKEYVIDLNATQAAIRAGYSADTADVQGSRLLANVKVESFIKELKNNKSNELNITFEDVVSQMYDIAKGGKRDSDKIKALEQTAKLLGFYEKDNSQKKTELIWKEIKTYEADSKTDSSD